MPPCKPLSRIYPKRPVEKSSKPPPISRCQANNFQNDARGTAYSAQRASTLFLSIACRRLIIRTRSAMFAYVRGWVCIGTGPNRVSVDERELPDYIDGGASLFYGGPGAILIFLGLSYFFWFFSRAAIILIFCAGLQLFWCPEH